jgi:GNAT superfamily N-acetyltransferase
MEKVTADRAGLTDLDQAWEIVNEYYDAVDVVVREDRSAFEGLYFSDGAGLWLARIGPTVAGCIALRPLAVFPRAGEVKRLYVQPSSRGQGIAGLLLDTLHDYAKSAGYEWLYLDSKDDLRTAITFYEKRGYVPCERYNDNPQATVFMKKRISQTLPANCR